jgi:hypothetical protein
MPSLVPERAALEGAGRTNCTRLFSGYPELSRSYSLVLDAFAFALVLSKNCDEFAASLESRQ